MPHPRKCLATLAAAIVFASLSGCDKWIMYNDQASERAGREACIANNAKALSVDIDHFVETGAVSAKCLNVSTGNTFVLHVDGVLSERR